VQLNVKVDKALLEKAMTLSGLSDENILLQEALNLFIEQKFFQQILLTEISEIAHRCATLPDVDERSEEEILGYDETGLLIHGD